MSGERQIPTGPTILELHHTLVDLIAQGFGAHHWNGYDDHNLYAYDPHGVAQGLCIVWPCPDNGEEG